MKGTENQIKWAEEIKAATIETIDYVIRCLRDGVRNQLSETLIAELQDQREALIACDNAVDIIYCFDSVQSSDALLRRAEAFNAACRYRRPENDTQRKMLGR